MCDVGVMWAWAMRMCVCDVCVWAMHVGACDVCVCDVCVCVCDVRCVCMCVPERVCVHALCVGVGVGRGRTVRACVCVRVTWGCVRMGVCVTWNGCGAMGLWKKTPKKGEGQQLF